MTKASCHNCIYACWDLCQAMQSFSSGWPHRPLCANHPDTPSLMRPTPLGEVCRNYRPRPATPEGDVKRIPLSGGMYAYVDAADYEWLSKYSWRVFSGGYAMRCEEGKGIFMHREIMQPPEGMVVDHIDSNRGNNCRFNLRVCTPAENCRNRVKRAHASSRFKGVGYDKRSDRYYANCRDHGEHTWLGYFDDEIEAARAYDYQAVRCRGRFARVNFPEEWPPERIEQVYAPHQTGPKRAVEEGAKGAKGVKGEKGEKTRTEESKSRHAAKGRGKEGKRPRGKKTAPHAQTRGRGTHVARRKTSCRKPGPK